MEVLMETQVTDLLAITDRMERGRKSHWSFGSWVVKKGSRVQPRTLDPKGSDVPSTESSQQAVPVF